MREGILRGIAFAGALGLSTAAFSATVEVVAGTVSLNQGGGFKKISTSAPAAAGDVVLTGPQGVAYIVYENGCREKVDSSQSATVSDPSVCKEVGLSADGSQMAVGALAVGGIIAGAVIIGTSGDDDRAASP